MDLVHDDRVAIEAGSGADLPIPPRRGTIRRSLPGSRLHGRTIALAALACLFVGCDPTSPDGDPSIHFADPALEAAVRETLEQPNGPISPAELAELVELRAPDRGISDLSGLEHAVSLELLDLARNQLRELAPLSALGRLHTVRLAGNEIADLSSLEDLKGLRYLDVARNRVESLSPLNQAAELELLILPENDLQDLSPLGSLPTLRGVELAWNEVVDLSPLVSAESLAVLGLRGNPLTEEARCDQVSILEERGVRVLGAEPCSPDEPAPRRLVTTGQDLYVAERTEDRAGRTHVFLEVEVGYENLLDRPVYIHYCQGFHPPWLERAEEGTWSTAYYPGFEACADAMEVLVGEAVRWSWEIRGYGPESGRVPWEPGLDAVEGTYRLDWRAVHRDWELPDPEPAPPEERTSAPFELLVAPS